MKFWLPTWPWDGVKVGVPPVGDGGPGGQLVGYVAQSGPVTGWKPMVLWTRRGSPHVAIGRRQSIIGVPPVGDTGFGGAIGWMRCPIGPAHRLEAYGTLDSARFTPRGHRAASKYHRRPACGRCWIRRGDWLDTLPNRAGSQAGSLWYFAWPEEHVCRPPRFSGPIPGLRLLSNRC
jgi:hypothetical protein